MYLRSTTYVLVIVSANMARLAPNKASKPRQQVTSASRATRSNDKKGGKTTNTVCILPHIFNHLQSLISHQNGNYNPRSRKVKQPVPKSSQVGSLERLSSQIWLWSSASLLWVIDTLVHIICTTTTWPIRFILKTYAYIKPHISLREELVITFFLSVLLTCVHWFAFSIDFFSYTWLSATVTP